MVGMGMAGTRSETPEEESRTPEQESQIIKEIAISIANMKEGDVLYVLSNRWWKEWMLYVGHGAKSVMFGSKPGSIDNSDIVLGLMNNDCDTEPELRDGLNEGTDYVVLHKDVWIQLYKWYGGGPILARKAIAVGPLPKQVTVEVYPLWLHLVVAPEEKQFTLRMSRKDTLGELYRRTRERFKLRSEKIRIWNFKGRTRHNLLVDCEDQTLEEAQLEMGQEILLEVDRESSCNSPKTLNSGGETNMSVCWNTNTVLKRHQSDQQQENDTQGLTLWPPLKRVRSSVVQENDTATLPATPQRPRIYADKDNSSCFPKEMDGFLGFVNRTIQQKYKDAHKDNSSRLPMELHNFGFMNGSLQHKDNSSCSPMKSDNSVGVRDNSVGLRGFENLGNTCYMNSALQCVLHIPELVEFFTGNYKEHINHDNSLGYKGKLATAFGELLEEAWRPGKALAPRSFKETLGLLKPNFSGYRQEDAQEFLIFLLDGLHEDLNRVKSKIYTEIDDDNECSDEALADKYRAHLKIDSIIQDLFGGQCRGTTMCTTCGRVKRNFDPFTNLVVRFPETLETRVTVFSSDGTERPAQHTITVNQETTYQDIVNTLSSLCSIRADEKLLLAEISNCQIVRYLDKPSDPFSNTADNVILVAYRLPVVQEKLPLLVLHHQNQSEEGGKLAPLVAWLGHGTQTGADVQAVVRTLLSPMLRTQIKEKEDGDVAMECIEISISTEEGSSFILYLADEDGNKTQTIIKEDEPIPFLDSRQRLQVIVEWTEEKMKKYETECLSNLPIAKRESEIRNRDENLNLYTMLESMYKETVSPHAGVCPQCKESRQAIQKIDIWKLPEILVVFLSRFHYDGRHTSKIETFVDFPIDGFDLSKFVINKNDTKGHIYKLFAITNHTGSLNFGHYTAFVKVRDGWHKFNDQFVSPITEEAIKTSKAYLLFYRRVNSED